MSSTLRNKLQDYWRRWVTNVIVFQVCNEYCQHPLNEMVRDDPNSINFVFLYIKRHYMFRAAPPWKVCMFHSHHGPLKWKENDRQPRPWSSEWCRTSLSQLLQQSLRQRNWPAQLVLERLTFYQVTVAWCAWPLPFSLNFLCTWNVPQQITRTSCCTKTFSWKQEMFVRNITNRSRGSSCWLRFDWKLSMRLAFQESTRDPNEHWEQIN